MTRVTVHKCINMADKSQCWIHDVSPLRPDHVNAAQHRSSDMGGPSSEFSQCEKSLFRLFWHRMTI